MPDLLRIANPDHDGAEVAAWFDPHDIPLMGPAIRRELFTTPWPVIDRAGLGLVAKTAAPVEGARGARNSEPEPLAKAAADDLRRWRSNARSRHNKGQPPRKFQSDHIPNTVAEAVWARLAKARSADEVEAAFVLPVAKASPPKAQARNRRASEAETYWQAKLAEALRLGIDPKNLAAKWMKEHS